MKANLILILLLGLVVIAQQKSYLKQAIDDGDDRDECNPDAEDEENTERCPGLPCEANYQCFTNECDKNLLCAAFRSESRFNGIVALLGFLLASVGLTAIGILRLCRNRITRESLRERLAGVISEKSKKSKKQPQQQKEKAEFVIRKATMRANRTGENKYNPYSINGGDDLNSTLEEPKKSSKYQV